MQTNMAGRVSSTLAALVLVIAALLLPGCGRSTPDYGADLQQMVEQKWDEYGRSIGHARTGGAALYITSPKGAYFASANMDKANKDILFRIASITKTFTAAAIMLLHQRGELDIDDPVTADAPRRGIPYLPETADYSIPHKEIITIRALLNHTAGVFDIDNDTIPFDAACGFAGQDYVEDVSASAPAHQFTFDELAGVVAACGVSYGDSSGHSYHYSDTGYSLLGKIIERVSGMSYSDFITENLIKPNGLTRTSSPHLAQDTAMPGPFALGYALADGRLSTVDGKNMSSGIANGNLISTPADLTTWIRNLITGKAGVDKAYVDEMKDCSIPADGGFCYQLGIGQWRGLGYGHTGGMEGYLSIVSYDPVTDVSAVLFFSLFNGDDIDGQANLLVGMVAEAREILGY